MRGLSCPKFQCVKRHRTRIILSSSDSSNPHRFERNNSAIAQDSIEPVVPAVMSEKGSHDVSPGTNLGSPEVRVDRASGGNR